MIDVIAVATTAMLAFALYRLRGNERWRAAATPLASIIGSGFLIIAPLLHALVGRYALLALAGLGALAYAVGMVLRYNIGRAEPLAQDEPEHAIVRFDRLSQLVLGAAYAISVAFYARLFVAFLGDRVSLPTSPESATTVLLAGVATIAWHRGTRGLENIELATVTVKVAIIAGVLAGLAWFALEQPAPWFQHDPTLGLGPGETLAVLAGLLMVTQGFETTRFTGAHYSPQARVRAARDSQHIALVLYFAFIGLTCPLFLLYPIEALTETTVSWTLGNLALTLPLLLLVAATASQLSAALADTIGGGGLLRGLLPLAASERVVYLMLVAVAIVIVWSVDVFGIIAFASRGFALFYLMQTLVACALLLRERPLRPFVLAVTAVLALLLAAVVLFAAPAPHAS